MGSERQRRVAGGRKRLDRLRRAPRIGLIGVAQVREHAVGAVHARVAERLVGDRQDPAALLAGRLGDQLLDPQPEALRSAARR